MDSGSYKFYQLLKTERKAFFVLGVWTLIAIVGPILTHAPSEGFIPPLIPYSPENIDLPNAGSIGPFGEQEISSSYYRHWLGTDEFGRDTFSQLIHGAKTAFWVGIGSVLLSAIIGIFLGAIAAYIGDNGLKLNRSRFIASFFLSLLTLFYFAFVMPWTYASGIGFLILNFLLIYLNIYSWYLTLRSKRNRNIQLPLDLIIGRLIELMDSLPILFIIIALSAILAPSIWSLILIIGISNWAVIARYTRAEILSVKERPYIEAAKALGLSPTQILIKHVLPNAIGPVLITLSFGLAAAILIESTLSFLGIGIGIEDASWGSMMAEGRKDASAWWLVVPPGLAIFLLVYSCNRIADRISK